MVVNEGGRELPRIVDFGIAKLAEADSGEQKLTAQGCVVGTPAYMSPEQACGEPIDIRSDFFSLGLITYELLAGKKPFDGSPMEVARQNISSNPPPISHRSPQAVVSPELEALVFKMLAKHREDRPQEASEIFERLADIYGSDVIFPGAVPVRKSQSRPDMAPGDDMLAALSNSAARFRTSASETIASLERAAFGGSRRKVIVALVALIVLVSGVGLMRLLSNSGSDSGITAESLAATPAPAEPSEVKAEPAGTHGQAAEPEVEADADPQPATAADEESRRPVSAQKRRTSPAPSTTRRRPRERVEAKEVSAPPPGPKAEKADKGEKDEKGPPVSTSDFSRKYIRVGGLVDRLAREKGRTVAEPFGDRYIKISLTDSLRLDPLRNRNMAELNRLENQIEAKLK